MKRAYNLICLISVLIGVLYTVPSEVNQWKGEIEYEDGIKVIKNPPEPLYGEIEFELEEDLSIGNEKDEKCYFYGWIDIGVDSEGNIYVLDRRNYRVQKFDQDGNFAMTIGRQGQGPGEFREPMGLFIDRNNRLSVLDRRMIHVFNKNGEFANSIGLKNFVSQYSFTNGEKMVCLVSTRSEQGREEEIILLNQEGERLKSYTKSILPVFIKQSRIITGGGPYNPRLIFYPWLKGGAIYGHSSEYRIFFIDSKGETAFIAEKAEPPVEINRKERNEFYDNMYESYKNAKSPWEPLSMKDIKQAYPLPKYKPFFLLLFSDDEGNVYVFRIFPLFDKQREIEFDLFNSQGY